MSLVSELKRRKVVKVVVAYLVVAWVVIEVAATVAPLLGLPDWAPRLITLVVLLGFPVALVLSWIYDVTPDGIRTEAASSGSKVLYALALGLAVAALGWFWKSRPGPGSETANARSIAVLPFVNMSGDPQQEYFSDGITEEILNVLARTPDLAVAARTSSFAFKGQPKEVPEIARELNVRLVLEGSVRRQDDRVRITAQLIDAETGYHRWSQTFDRELTDIFAIQDEIAEAIGRELQVQVAGGGDATPAADTVSIRAHDLYLRGLSDWRSRTEQGLWDAVAAFDSAASIDPDFAPAWAGLGLTYAVIADYSPRISGEEAFRRGRNAALRALALDPSSPDPYLALGTFELLEGNAETGLPLLRRATGISPSNATAHQWLGTGLATAHDLEEGLASLRRASELDPRSGIVANNHAWMLMAAGRNADAIAVCEPVLRAAPDDVLCLEMDGLARLLESGPAAAGPSLRRWARQAGPGAEREVEALLAALDGGGDRRAFARWLAALPVHRTWVGTETENVFFVQDVPAILMLLDQPDLALDFIERAADDPWSYVNWGIMLPALDPIRCEPRFRAAARKAGLADGRAASICAPTA